MNDIHTHHHDAAVNKIIAIIDKQCVPRHCATLATEVQRGRTINLRPDIILADKTIMDFTYTVGYP